MSRIVNSGMKLDLHIHSSASSLKDGKKVKNNTIDNINTLIKNLDKNNVNLCAVTDHDTFSYGVYSSLKKAEQQNNSIIKVLPGIEFSVLFSNGTDEKVIHVVGIFNDIDDAKVKKIEQILFCNAPQKNGAYTEAEFLNLLRIIDLDTILIAHQKNTPTSSQTRKNDANNLGNRKFFEFIHTDYFEAFEFKNKRNEVINKHFIFQNDIEDEIRFITGSDCHDWECYPCEDASDSCTDFPFTFAKCLPTFRGLVMAITDHRRLKFVNSFFPVDDNYVKEINLSINNNKIDIPLSKGINVIIGDNSIGKSMLLHALTDFSKRGLPLSKDVSAGYKKYMKAQKIKVDTLIRLDDVFHFDMQGEVRKKFEENSINRTEFLKDYFPQDIDTKPYRMHIENEISRMTDYLDKKFKIDSLRGKLTIYSLPFIDKDAESLSFNLNLSNSKKKTNDLDDIITKIDTVIITLNNLEKLIVDKDDRETIRKSIESFSGMLIKYRENKEEVLNENNKIDKVDKIIRDFRIKYNRVITDRQKQFDALQISKSTICSQIIEIIKQSRKIVSYSPGIEERKIIPQSNTVFEYIFISKLSIEKIDVSYFKSLIDFALKSGKKINWDTISEHQLRELLLRYDDSISAIEYLKKKLAEKIDNDLSNKHAIIQKDMDLYEDLSAGLDSKIYFDLLSYETARRGVYIIDQPEDNVSQSAIHTYLLDRFKTMGEHRQVLMVTHNPQFIVNLDIDNLISIIRENNKLKIQSGALEYYCDDYNILEIIAESIDGGLDTIQKRWKRYEKVNRI